MQLSKPAVVMYINHFLPLPHPSFHCSIRSVMQKYLEERDELTFDKIFNQKIGKFHSFVFSILGENMHN